ncbi:MAG: DNA gyrase inhibitor YacG [Acidobacteriaceae bacterium]
MAKEKSTKSSALRCPTCGTLVLRDDEDFPFCSDRCRIIDLGKWASGAYRISSPILDPEVLEGLDERHRGGHNSGEDE